MESKQIPNMIRENFVYKFNESGFSINEFIREYEQRIYSMLDGRKLNELKIYTYTELMIAYCDFVKIMSYKKRQNVATLDDYYYLCSMDNIETSEDLLTEISVIPAFLEEILKSMYQFYMMSYLGRSNLFRNLSESENKYLSKITEFHTIEKEEYLDEVKLEDYLSHYKMKLKILENNNDVEILNIEHIIEEIRGFILNLSITNYENYLNNIKDLIIFYYEWTKYDCTHEKNLLEEEISIKEDFVSQFESMTFEEMGNEILCDQDFLFFLIDFYCTNSTKKVMYYEDGRYVEYSEVEKYVENLEDEKVKEKIKYKKTRI